MRVYVKIITAGHTMAQFNQRTIEAEDEGGGGGRVPGVARRRSRNGGGRGSVEKIKQRGRKTQKILLINPHTNIVFCFGPQNVDSCELTP